MKKLDFDKVLENLSKHACTNIGEELCLNLKPNREKEIVSKLILETNEVEKLIFQKGNPPFCNFNNVSNYLKILEFEGILSIAGLLEINKILKMSHNLKGYFYEDEQFEINNFPILNEIFSVLYSNISIEKKISDSIIDENTIADDASKELLTIRKKEKRIQDEIKSRLNNFIHSPNYSKYIQENVITIRNDRYVIPVKEEYRSNIKGFIHDTSKAGSTVFIEPTIIFDLNNEYNNLKIEENIEIEKILKELSASLYPYIDEIVKDVETIGNLDFIFAKAKYSKELNCTMPNLTDEKIIELKQARHPLIPMEQVVSNDIYIGKDFSSLIITGPNTGGKTVTLKTIGVICAMVACGMNIPANEGSKIFLFDNIFDDIGDEQSIVESLSTFSSHMINIVNILNNATEKSMVLLDELRFWDGSC